MKTSRKSYCINGIIGAIALMPCIGMADNSHLQLTVYSQVEDGVTAAVSSDFDLQGNPSPGASYVQGSDFYLTSNRTGTPAGKAYVVCNLLLGPVEAQCAGTFKFVNGDTIDIQGYISEAAQVPPLCQPSFNVVSVSGGTGNFIGVQGQLGVTHTPVNPDPANFCAHSVHNYKFDFTLLSNLSRF